MRQAGILLLLLLIFSCKKNNEENNVTSQPETSSLWSFSAEVDSFLTSGDSAKGYLHIDTLLGLPIRTFFIAGFCPGRNIYPGFTDSVNSLTLIAQNYDTIPATDVAVDYQPLNDTINNDFSQISSGFIITSVDTINKLASGNFAGVVVGNVTGDTVRITHGLFANIKYEIW